jgi:DNA-binding NtrC family response regulator
MLAAYDWPGNVRQLENAVFRASVLCDGDTLTADDFPQIRAQVDGIDLDSLDRGPVRPSAPADEPLPRLTRPASPDPTPPGGHFGLVKALDDRGNVRSLADVELEMIKLAIAHYDGQMSEVARRLGIGRSTLYRKLKEYGLDPESGRNERLAS